MGLTKQQIIQAIKEGNEPLRQEICRLRDALTPAPTPSPTPAPDAP